MKAIVLGGTKGMGRALARILAERGDSVYLLGRDSEQLAPSAADLTARHPSNEVVGWGECDLEKPDGFAAAIAGGVAYLGRADAIVVTAGLFGVQSALEEDTEFARRMLTVNFANTVTFCEHARKYLLGAGGGTLCAFSSVAGDRGRKPVALYGASKAGLSHDLESLDHKFRADGLRTVCVKPGFVRTGMTAGLPAPPFAGDPDRVAQQVVAAMDRGAPLVYVPGIWRLVMLVIKHLPRFVMRKINF
jgi:NAD(P)-dependent dehydrogenase (short-subunit alcohol dehydrogenase family)